MKTVSNSWLRIRPASCMRLSVEYIAGKQPRRPEQLQRIDDEIQRRRQQHDRRRWRPETATDFSTMRSSEPEIDEFAVLLDSENAERQHRRGGVEEERPHPPRAESLADASGSRGRSP